MPKSKNGDTRDRWKKPVRSDQIYSNNSAMNPIITEITASQVKKDITPFKVGDGVRVHTKVREGDKERVQVFQGVVIRRQNGGIHETFTVRKLSYGVGVERIFPVQSPRIEKLEVVSRGRALLAKCIHAREHLADTLAQRVVARFARFVDLLGALGELLPERRDLLFETVLDSLETREHLIEL